MASFITAELILFAVTAVVWLGKDGLFASAVTSTNTAGTAGSKVTTTSGDDASSTTTPTTCSTLKNSAFVFIKPHANTILTQKLVRDKLLSSGCTILSESDIDGPTIDKNKLIDQHYYAIGTYKSKSVFGYILCLASINENIYLSIKKFVF
jgi:hypothetical protein